MNNFASLRLVLHSTGVAAKALRALAIADTVFPDGRCVVDNTLRSITVALRQVDGSLVFKQPPLIPKPSTAAIIEAVVEILEDDPLPRDPAFIDQEINGCKTLLLEVIRRAAYDWVLYRTSRRLIHKRLAEDAYSWLFVEKPGHPNWEERTRVGKAITSFLAICSELDLDADTVRSYVRKLTVKNVMSVGRPAEYRRRDTCQSIASEEHVAALRSTSWEGIEASTDSGGSDEF